MGAGPDSRTWAWVFLAPGPPATIVLPFLAGTLLGFGTLVRARRLHFLLMLALEGVASLPHQGRWYVGRRGALPLPEGDGLYAPAGNAPSGGPRSLPGRGPRCPNGVRARRSPTGPGVGFALVLGAALLHARNSAF
ncbi:hypothetical protein [Deinococcus hopiensis]|uniref:hypothetical protein n=1 Tax=Deinococcus hopiensis TaxID=309885 RepID=UPI000A00D47A|nr:hypothetical protein [Deinococcus hopiensis]